MKIAVLVALICLIPIVVKAVELGELARKERLRRQRLTASREGTPCRSFDDSHLEIYRRLGDAPSTRSPQRAPVVPSRDLDRERAFWRKEKSQHDRDLARLDAQIRRLEWRLAERKARRKPGERLRRDATEEVLEESIESLREERAHLVQSFHERGRKAGALPGWLR